MPPDYTTSEATINAFNSLLTSLPETTAGIAYENLGLSKESAIELRARDTTIKNMNNNIADLKNSLQAQGTELITSKELKDLIKSRNDLLNTQIENVGIMMKYGGQMAAPGVKMTQTITYGSVELASTPKGTAQSVEVFPTVEPSAEIFGGAETTKAQPSSIATYNPDNTVILSAGEVAKLLSQAQLGVVESKLSDNAKKAVDEASSGIAC